MRIARTGYEGLKVWLHRGLPAIARPAGECPRAAGALFIGGFVLVLSGCGAAGDAARTAEQSAPATPTIAASVAALSTPPAPRSPTASPPPQETETARQSLAGPPVPPTPGGSTAAFRSPGAEVGPIVWAAEVDPLTKVPRTAVESFPADTGTLFAAVPVERMEPGTEVRAEWSYNGSLLDIAPVVVRSDGAARGAWLEFHLTRSGDTPWPEGIYAVRVLIDGAPAVEAAIVVGAVPTAG